MKFDEVLPWISVGLSGAVLAATILLYLKSQRMANAPSLDDQCDAIASLLASIEGALNEFEARLAEGVRSQAPPQSLKQIALFQDLLGQWCEKVGAKYSQRIDDKRVALKLLVQKAQQSDASDGPALQEEFERVADDLAKSVVLATDTEIDQSRQKPNLQSLLTQLVTEAGLRLFDARKETQVDPTKHRVVDLATGKSQANSTIKQVRSRGLLRNTTVVMRADVVA